MSNYDYNHVVLLGFTGEAPWELCKPDTCVVSLATNKTWTHNGEEKAVTHWQTLIFNGRLSEVALKYIQKGDRLFIEGELVNHEYTDKQGEIKYSVNVLVKKLRFLTPRNTQVIADDGFEQCYDAFDIAC
jgi:single-strand DNA-binding protein